MLKMKNKDLIMFGMIIGIGFFFIGAMISNIFPSNEESLASYKVAAFLKLFGIGILTACMVVGGIIITKIDRNLRMLLLLMGLILLIIYTVGSPTLNWEVTSMASPGSDSDYDEAYNERPTSLGTPGFEFLYAIIALIILGKVRKKG